MIAVKREVAVRFSLRLVIPWSESQVKILATSHCTINLVHLRMETPCVNIRTHPEKCTVTNRRI